MTSRDKVFNDFEGSKQHGNITSLNSHLEKSTEKKRLLANVCRVPEASPGFRDVCSDPIANSAVFSYPGGQNFAVGFTSVSNQVSASDLEETSFEIREIISQIAVLTPLLVRLSKATGIQAIEGWSFFEESTLPPLNLGVAKVLGVTPPGSSGDVSWLRLVSLNV